MEIVGLKIFVQDDINKLIAKFVGVKPPKFMKELEFYISHQNDHQWHHRHLLLDLGVRYEDIMNDEYLLTFAELTLTAIKNKEWENDEYLKEQRKLNGWDDSEEED